MDPNVPKIAGVDEDVDSSVNYDDLSTEEINLKIKTFRNLCLGNKINSSNAFDIDMIGYFATWLSKKTSLTNIDVESFQEIADYLDASEKVYGLRVDNVTNSTNKLVEQLKIINLKKAALNTENGKEEVKMPKPKRPKVMLTTEQLKCKTTDTDDFVDPCFKQGISNFGFNDLSETCRPSTSMVSLFTGNSFKEDKETVDDKKLENDKGDFFSIPDFEDILAEGAICPKFSGFVDEDVKINDAKETETEGIENRFDPESYVFQGSSSNNEDHGEGASSSNDNNQSNVSGLLDCIDNVKRDYSFFNPKLLANWKGPKAWKAQAMVKALKSCNPNERKRIMSMPNISGDIQELTTKPDTIKKPSKKKVEPIKINWRTLDDISKEPVLKVVCKEKLMPRTLKKWNGIYNIADTKSTVDIKHKFEFLRYHEILPQWWIKKLKNKSIKSDGECYDAADGITDDDVDNIIPDKNYGLVNLSHEEHKELVESLKFNESLSEDEILKEFKNEPKMDIGELKKKISEIIDQECTEIDPDNEWSSKLYLSDLLKILKVNEQEGLTVPMVFVGLLHLTNERGLKIFEEPSSIIDVNELCISKPMKKCNQI